jgi:hypothetical protein
VVTVTRRTVDNKGDEGIRRLRSLGNAKTLGTWVFFESSSLLTTIMTTLLIKALQYRVNFMIPFLIEYNLRSFRLFDQSLVAFTIIVSGKDNDY